MTDSYPPPPPGDDQPSHQPPPAPPAPAQPPAPGQWGAPPPGPPIAPPAPGTFGSPPAYGSPPPSLTPGYPTPGYPTPGNPGGYGAGGQIPAQPYQYGKGVPNQVALAEPGKRIIARIIDWLIMFAILVPMYFLLIGLGTSSSGSDAASGLFLGGMFMFMILATVGQVAYEVAFIAIKGQTPGKMAMKVRVVRHSDGQIPGWGPAFMRWLPNLVGLVPCVGSLLSLGLMIWALVNLFSNPLRQTPFDLAAKTVVVNA